MTVSEVLDLMKKGYYLSIHHDLTEAYCHATGRVGPHLATIPVPVAIATEAVKDNLLDVHMMRERDYPPQYARLSRFSGYRAGWSSLDLEGKDYDIWVMYGRTAERT